MSMHLEGPALTTTSYKKRREKITKAKQEQLERDWRDRNQRLKSIGLPKETFEQFLDWVYGRGKKTKEKEKSGGKITTTTPGFNHRSPDTSIQASKAQTAENTSKREWITGAVSSPAPKIYTGTKVKGIAQTHKSNAIPIFDETHIIDIAHMRR